MKKALTFLISTLMIITSCEKEVKNNNGSILEDTKKLEITTLLNRYHELNRFSGTVLITKDSVTIYNNSFGYADYKNKKRISDQTAFKVGEISELITKDMLYGFVQEGQIKLTDTISTYLPELKLSHTIDDLINHKTNLPTIAQIRTQNPDLKYTTLLYTKLAVASSDVSEKSDLNFNITGALIEKVSGKSYQENVADYAKQLDLSHTYFNRKDSAQAIGYLFHNYRNKGLELQESPAYNLDMAFSSRGLKSTAEDLSKIIHSKYRKTINKDGYLDDDGFSYAIRYKADDGIAIIILSNRRHPVTKEISNAIEAILTGKHYKMPLKRNPVKINTELLNDYLGDYKINEYVTFSVTKENDSLFVLLGPNKVALIPQSNNQFYMINNDASMRFEKDSTDRVNSVVLLNGFVDSSERAFKIKN